MIRSRFEKQLQALSDDMIIMGALCEDIILKATKTVEVLDLDLIEAVDSTYRRIEQLEKEIESQCLKLLLLQQPVASDLRRVSSSLKMVYDLKRIGAQSAEIAEISRAGQIQKHQQVIDLSQMVDLVISMVTTSVSAFVQGDLVLVGQVIEKDDAVDREFDTIKEQLIKHLAGGELADGEYVIATLMVAKYIERIGDHSVNIANWVKYSMTGQLDGEKT